jgi:hypothetical protein
MINPTKKNTWITLFFVAAAALGCQKANVDILPVGDKQVSVGQTLVFDVCVSGASGQKVTFTFEVPDISGSHGANLTPYSNVCATFRWTPRSEHAGHHAFTFRASAGGSSDTETIDIEVMGGSSAPVFLQPGAGGTYDLSRDPCVNVHIEVKDDDSLPTSIVIAERDPRIEGGALTQSGKTADWHWCPTPQQIEANDRYTLMLQAQDESHTPVPHDFVIVLRGVGKDDCPNIPPVIAACSPPPPDTVASNRDYAVSATITDDLGIKEMPILYYSFAPPANPDKPDVTAFNQAIFESAGGDAYTAWVPNQGLAPGDVRTVYYIISVTDNDDSEGVLCDHRVDSALFQFDITGGEDVPGAYCERCSASAQCASGGCVVASPSNYCGGACADCAALGGVCQDVTVVGGAVMNLCVPASGSCSTTTTCTDDGFEDNDSSAAAWPVTPNVYTGLMICPRDEDYYSVSVGSSSQIDVVIDGWNADVVDIDLQLRRPDGTIAATSASLDAQETISACVESAGNYVIRVYGILDDSSAYSMLVDVYASSCCANDALEYNDTSASATSISSPGVPLNGTICPSDNDWFSIWSGGGQLLTADLTMTGGDLDLEVYDTDGTRRLASSTSGGTTPEYAEADLVSSGTYFVRVKGFLSAQGTYTLTVNLGTSSGCTDTLNCPVGTVCNGTDCIDDSCTPPGSCPSGHFCPDPGGSDWTSDCVDTCTTSSECRSGYACKTFYEGRGCGGTGYGNPGDACYSFRACEGEMTCLEWTGGYCATIDCWSSDDCPSGSYCVGAGSDIVCAKDCLWGDDLCRLSEGYHCDCVTDADGTRQWVCLAPGVYSDPCY